MIAEQRFAPGGVYRRRELHRRFAGQERGGIITPKRFPIILIVSGASGRQHGYEDHWSADGIFFYYGEGQHGDMQFTKGNRAIRDHVENGKDIHLFEEVPKRDGFLRYRGQVVCTGTEWADAPDTTGVMRKAIVFELTPIEQLDATPAADETTPQALADRELTPLSLEELRQRAIANSASARTPRERKASYYVRSRAIKLYILRRAAGKCEGCANDAPFATASGPYLEPHHIRRLSDGGPDDPRFVIGVCPNCHRRAHYSTDAEDFNANLGRIAARLEHTAANSAAAH